MTISDCAGLFRRHWMLILLTGIGVTLAALFYSLALTATFRASAQVFVSTQGGSSIDDLNQGSTFTQQRVKSYVDLATSPRLLEPVITRLQLATTPDDLATHVSASSPSDTVLIDITVTDTNAVRARDIANAIVDAYPTMVAELETPAGQTTSPVKVSRTKTAITPAVPVSPRTTLNVLLGLLLGTGIGIGLAVLRESLDKTVKSKEQLHGLAQAPVLTLIGDDQVSDEHRLITHDAFSPRSEAFRQLRTNIRFLSVDQRVRSLVVTSALPQEGKSSTASNLAIAMAQAGEHVVLIDADLRRPTIADVFAMPSGAGLTSVLLGDLQVGEAVQRWRDDLPLYVLTAGPTPPNPAELLGSERMSALISELTAGGAAVVLDSPPLLPVTDAALLASVTDGALVVVRAAKTHADQVAAACEAVRAADATVLGVVLNRVSRKGSSSYYGGYSYDTYSSTGADSADTSASTTHGRKSTSRAKISRSRRKSRDAANAPAAIHVAPHETIAPPAQSAQLDELMPWLKDSPEPQQPPVAPDTVGLPAAGSEAQPLPVPGTRIVLAAPEAKSSTAIDLNAIAHAWPDLATPRDHEDATEAVRNHDSGLPEAVRQAIALTKSPVTPTPMNPVTSAADQGDAASSGPTAVRPRGRRAAAKNPDLIINPDQGTFTDVDAGSSSAWPAEWGDLPALINAPRNGANHNGANGSSGARHRN